MLPTTRTLFDRVRAWVAATIATIVFPPDRYVSQADVRFDFTYNSAGSATVAEDGLLKAVKRLTLKVDGTPIRSWSPHRYWYLKVLDLANKPEFVAPTTTEATGKKASFVLPLFFRNDPKNDRDVSALLPAHYLSNIELEIEWGAANAFGANQTITAGSAQVTLHERTLDAQEETRFYGVSGPKVIESGSRLQCIMESEQFENLSAAYPDNQFAMTLPTGHIQKRTAIYATLNGVRSDALVSRLQLRQESPIERTFTDEAWFASQGRDRAEYGLQAPLEGNFILPGLTLLEHTDYGGLDLRGRRPGEVKFRATTGTPTGETNIVLLHEGVKPMPIA